MTAKQEARLEELHAELADATEALLTSEGWIAYLAFAAQFHNYSANNVMLIAAQKPDATRVAGFNTWKGLGRMVRKGEKAIWILAPMKWTRKETDEVTGEETKVSGVRGFKAVPVFDVSQTDGEPIPEVAPPVLLEGQAPAGLWDALAKQVAGAGYSLAKAPLTGGLRGQTSPGTREVVVDENLSDLAATKTLAHEVAHIVCGHVDDMVAYSGGCRGRMECEAESTAAVVLGAHGVDTHGYSIPYLAAWAGGDTEQVRKTAQAVVKAAHTILTEIEKGTS